MSAEGQHRNPTPAATGALVTRAPNTVLVLAGLVLAVAVIAAFVVVILAGKPTTELRDLITLILAGVGALTGTGSLLYSGSAARSSAAAEEQTDGSLDRRIAAAVARALAADRSQHPTGRT